MQSGNGDGLSTTPLGSRGHAGSQEATAGQRACALTEGDEVGRGLRRNVAVHADDDAAERIVAVGDVEEHLQCRRVLRQALFLVPSCSRRQLRCRHRAPLARSQASARLRRTNARLLGDLRLERRRGERVEGLQESSVR